MRLGVDVGQVRVGVAASDPSGLLATPVSTLARDLEFASDQQQIADLARQRAVVEVVVGLPRSLSGAEGLAAQQAREYAASLHRLLAGIPVRLVDERLTTVAAHRAMHATGVPGRQHRNRVDQAAAVLILQAALDAERSTGRPAGAPVGGRKPRAARPAGRDEGTER